MSISRNRALTLLATLAVAMAACSGDKGPAGPPGPKGDPGGQGTFVPPGLTSVGIVVDVTGTSTANNAVSVTFTMKDLAGLPLDAAGAYSLNTAIQPRFALAYISTAADGSVLPYTVLTKSGTPAQPTAFNPAALTNGALNPTANGVLVENGTGAGSYTYTFPASVVLDATKLGNTHTVWIQVTRQTDLNDPQNTQTFTAVNKEFNFVPNGGTPPVEKREIVKTENCSKCHSNFKPEGLVSNGFHGAGRMEAPFCNICHNVGRVSNPSASSENFVHRIHAAKDLQVFTSGTRTVGSKGTSTTCTVAAPCTCTVAAPCSNAFHNIDETAYPQDLRNCKACHDGALQGAQYQSKPTRAACGSCHDYVSFDGLPAGLPFCSVPIAKDAAGKPVPCVHNIGVQADDSGCAGCHSPSGGATFIGDKHLPIAEPNEASILVPVTSGSSKAGVQTTTTCTAGSPCACGSTAGTICISPDYTFVTTGTVTDGAFFSSAGAACSASAPCTCAAATPCFANPFAQVKSGSASAGFGGGTACTAAAPCAACTVGSPCIGAGNNNTNAAFVAAAGAIPAGAIQISYDIKSVSRDASKHPVIVFKLKQSVNGAAATDVVFNTFDPAQPTAGQELMPNFVGAPSVYWVFAVPQDNILKPADFNASDSAYVRSIWNHTATTTSAGTMTGPDAEGYYTITLSNAIVPDNATMLTGGVGYTYSLTANPPLVQTNVTGYSYDPVTRIGGLLVPAANVKKVATGYTGRRQIIDNKKCQACHVTLGANPTFHAGQRNDGESCSWCHNPNQNNSGWSGNAKDMIHALHAGTAAGVILPNGKPSAGTGKRSYPYTWDAVSQDEGFWEVTFPGPRNNCEACHATQSDPNLHTYDFSAPASAAAVPNLLWSTDATNAVTLQNFVTSVFGSSPYITTQDYGANASVSKATGVLTPGADTNLMTSPITAACIACHDSPAQKSHIIAMNGQFYVPRSVAKGLATTSLTDPNQESCLVCHGPQPNAIVPIADMHKQ